MRHFLRCLTSETVFHTLEGMDAKRDNGIGQVLDQANKKFGAMSVGIGWAGMRGRGRAKQESGAKWNMKRQKLSSRSTTRWDELATAKAQ